MTTEFVIYSRPGCHLCEVLEEELSALTAGQDVCIRVVDVDSSRDLTERWGMDIPVLVADGEEICRHRLDADRVRSWLRAR